MVRKIELTKAIEKVSERISFQAVSGQLGVIVGMVLLGVYHHSSDGLGIAGDGLGFELRIMINDRKVLLQYCTI